MGRRGPNIGIVLKVGGNVIVQFANNQLRLSLYQLPAESRTHKLSCASQEFTILFGRQ